MNCSICGVEINENTPSGMCHRCYDQKYSAERRKAAKAKAKARKPKLDSHPSDEELRARLLVNDPDGRAAVFSRQPDGTYLDLRSGQTAPDWRDFQ